MIMNKSIKVLIMTLIYTLSICSSYCMEGMGGQGDPLARMNYQLAFDQTKIHENSKV